MILKENAKTGAITSALSDRIHHPVFLSIDKDVLSADELETDWDQGSMAGNELTALCCPLSESSHILGVDICGEPNTGQDAAKSLRSNRELIEIFFRANGCSCSYKNSPPRKTARVAAAATMTSPFSR